MSSSMSVFSFPTLIHSGPGAIQTLGPYIQAKNLKRPLLVTDENLRQLPLMKIVEAALKPVVESLVVYSNFSGNPIEAHVIEGKRAFESARCDCIVALGGGAAMDVAKAIAVIINNKGSLFEYEDVPDAKPITEPLPLIVAVPTTAGTGSEVGRSSVISDDKTHAKKIIYTPKMLPELAILDAELTLSLPASVTAATGMDALTHLMEAYLAKGHRPMCDGIALEGLGLVSQHLKKCVQLAKKGEGNTPEHLEHRQRMLEASMMGAVAFQKGLGVTHSCAHALSTVCDLHHGLANGILLPYTMKFNFQTEKKRFNRMAWALGIKSGDGKEVVETIEKLKKAIGVPRSLSELGVTSDHIPQLVDVARNDVCHPSNPRPVSDADFEKLFQKAL